MLKRLVRASFHFAAVFLTPDVSLSQVDVPSLLRRATSEFQRGEVQTAIGLWNEAVAAKPDVRQRLWQLGLAQYAVGQYIECAEQFEYDYVRNPDDTEEVVWAYLCNSKRSPSEGNTIAIENARKRMPAKQREDPRPVMRKVEAAYRGGDVSRLQDILRGYEQDKRLLAERSIQEHADYFYAALYTSLYFEAQGSPAAREYLEKAVSSLYGERSHDYMADVAKVLLMR